MDMDLENLSPKAKFCYIALIQAAIYLKEDGHEKDFFLAFCEEIWDSMEMNDFDLLKKALQEKMSKDLKPYVESYIKNQAGVQKNSEEK